MKTLILSGLAIFTLAFSAPKAQAGDKALAAIGGLIGGILIGSALDSHQNNYSYAHHNDRGHWKFVTVRIWAPGYWAHSYDDCGNNRRYWVQGHYTHRKNKVWINGRQSRHHDRQDRYSDNHRRRNHHANTHNRSDRHRSDRYANNHRSDRRNHSR